jgi:hypothetical protein
MIFLFDVKHFTVILEEMFSRVEDTYSPYKTEDDNWYWAHEWTEEERQYFIDWLTGYLYNNGDARREIMRWPQKNKKRCKETAKWFETMYGWKIAK